MIILREGDVMIWSVVIVVLCILILLYRLYVQLIQKKNNVREALGGIDVQLNKRYDLIPNILTVAEKFMEHERGLFDEITRLRTQAMGIKASSETIGEKLNLDKEIATKVGQLLVSVENYPQLKSDQTMVQVQQTYAEVEEHIAAARRFYNSAVKDLNNAVEIFPSSMVASWLSIKPYPFYEASEDARKPVNAADYLKK